MSTCGVCKGEGKVTCKSCKGTGTKAGNIIPILSELTGIGYDECRSCKGDGKKTCPACKGSGEK